MRIVILASSGGSAFIEAKNILDSYSPFKNEYFVLTDRACDIESYCLANNIFCERITYDNRKGFSQKVAKKIGAIGNIDVVILYFLRILTEDIFKKHLTLNIHPSLLPAFKGVHAVKQCSDNNVKFIGATLHLIDSGIDTGPIIGQIITPIHPKLNEDNLNKISFLQKVYLSLLAVDLLENKLIKFNSDFSKFELDETIKYTGSANPCIQNLNYLKGFNELQQGEGMQI